MGVFGLNTAMLRKVEELDFGYKPPKVVKACQADLAFPSALIDEYFQSHIVAITKILRYYGSFLFLESKHRRLLLLP